MENRCLNGQRFFFHRYREEQMEHRTGLESFYAVDEKNRKLRYGYTTGSSDTPNMDRHYHRILRGGGGKGSRVYAAVRTAAGGGGTDDAPGDSSASSD